MRSFLDRFYPLIYFIPLYFIFVLLNIPVVLCLIFATVGTAVIIFCVVR